MGLLGNLIVKGVATAARNSTIKVAGNAAVDVISATSQKQSQEDIVVKNGIVFIKPTRSSQDYLGENALDAVQELLCVGFEKVTLRPVKKLSEYSVKKYGQIHTISINGNSEFLGIKRIPASSYILIEYLDFRNNVNPNVYENVTRITSGTISNADEQEAQFQENNNTNNSKNFCPYCGEKIKNINAKFCSNCGQKIE